LEPAGALAIAGMKKYIERTQSRGKTFIPICSGANVDFARLRFIAERADNTERLMKVALTGLEPFRRLVEFLPFRSLCHFYYRKETSDENATAHVMLGVRGQQGAEFPRDLERAVGGRVMDLNDNALAKWHWQHMPMVGGDPTPPDNESLIRFELFDTGMQLRSILLSIMKNWSLSLVHYRNYGSDAVRVLVGVQVTAETKDKFQELLSSLTRMHVGIHDETLNPLRRSLIRA